MSVTGMWMLCITPSSLLTLAMPAGRKVTLKEQLQVAQDQLRATKKKLKEALAAQAVKPKKLIPRPKGQAGKGYGYNLQCEMGLARNKPRYNCLMVRGATG
ncbi:hypothetical protein DFH09DRAFT_1099084 [Mycena vulgaris]|nr:hypothetical protein DFH09DRAFT_1099084 [Mycena vulgaris]